MSDDTSNPQADEDVNETDEWESAKRPTEDERETDEQEFEDPGETEDWEKDKS